VKLAGWGRSVVAHTGRMFDGFSNSRCRSSSARRFASRCGSAVTDLIAGQVQLRNGAPAT
jgi:hypothetical protein